MHLDSDTSGSTDENALSGRFAGKGRVRECDTSSRVIPQGFLCPRPC
jgi:hypothetical protein